LEVAVKLKFLKVFAYSFVVIFLIIVMLMVIDMIEKGKKFAYDLISLPPEEANVIIRNMIDVAMSQYPEARESGFSITDELIQYELNKYRDSVGEYNNFDKLYLKYGRPIVNAEMVGKIISGITILSLITVELVEARRYDKMAQL
jgi:hypothetical protein